MYPTIGGYKGTCLVDAPQRSRLFCFDIQNFQDMHTFGVHAPHIFHAPHGKSLIHQCPPIHVKSGWNQLQINNNFKGFQVLVNVQRKGELITLGSYTKIYVQFIFFIDERKYNFWRKYWIHHCLMNNNKFHEAVMFQTICMSKWKNLDNYGGMQEFFWICRFMVQNMGKFTILIIDISNLTIIQIFFRWWQKGNVEG